MSNDFLPFCPTDTGSNLESQADYAVDTQRTTGNQPGIASSQLVNKALRQATAVSSGLAQFMANVLSNNLQDNGNANQLLGQIEAVLFKRLPVVTLYTSGSGTWNKTYSFKIASGNATVGATYTNNTNTYTVKSTISSGTILDCTGNGEPSANGGTLTKSTGTGDSTITFYAVQEALYIRVRAAGGGGGGGSQTGAGSAGSNTTFGTSLIQCNGGAGGLQKGTSGTPAKGGTATLGSGPVGLAIPGGDGQGSQDLSAGTGLNPNGGQGGGNMFGGGGAGGAGNSGAFAGGTAPANSGAGGGGCATSAEGSGGGGAAGGTVDGIITSPSATYAYVVGAGGGPGTGSIAGGSGATGFIEVTEFYQ